MGGGTLWWSVLPGPALTVLFSIFFKPVPSAVVKRDSLRNLAEK